MRLDRFAMERLQSTWENRVAWNLSESGVHPLRLEDLADTEADRIAIFGLELGYPQTNGTGELRQAISAMYPATTVEHIQVTNGGAEANCISLCHLVEPGDEVVIVSAELHAGPRALRVRSGRTCARGRSPARQKARWRADLDGLGTVVTHRTRLIPICNPNNPTGARFDPRRLDAICAVAARVGAWVLSDEIYRGAELDGQETASASGADTSACS